MTAPTTILVPIDFSDVGSKALDVACAQATACEARLHLLHVVDLRPLRPMGLDAGASTTAIDDLYEDVRRRLRSLADQITDKLRSLQRVEPHLREYGAAAATSGKGQQGVAVGARLVVESSLRTGDPAEEILACAQELEASLIIMGTHVRRGWTRWVLGSTTETVLRRAISPVMSVHPSVPSEVAEQPGVEGVEGAAPSWVLPTLRHTLRVRDCLRREAPKIALDAPLREVLQAMAASDNLPLAVLDNNGDWVGSITQDYLLQRLLLWEGHDLMTDSVATVEQLAQLQRHLHGQTARDVLAWRRDDIVVEDSAPLAQALEIMLARRTSFVFVVRRDALLGVLTGRDILRSYLEFDLGPLLAPLPPERIKELARSLLMHDPAFAATNLAIELDDGLLRVAGQVSDLAALRHGERLLRQVPGVRGLENRLVVAGHEASLDEGDLP